MQVHQSAVAPPVLGHRREVETGQRFEFGKNWQRFLARVDEARIAQASQSLRLFCGMQSLEGKSFLDVGSGSGLFSLAACRLGAERVHSFDYDPQSVACALELRRRYRPADTNWTVEQGSVLDPGYLERLGQFDIVYSWGVLHHTGAMWPALGNITSLVAPRGLLYIAIYNDQGGQSRRWHTIKRAYNAMPRVFRLPYAVAVMLPREALFAAVALMRGRPLDYVRGWTRYSDLSLRGMSRWHDLIDWVGGYPFEVARPEEVFRFYRDRGFSLRNLSTAGGIACNEYLFENLVGQPQP